MSKEYTGALAILLVSVLKLFGVEVGNEELTTIITGFVALYVAFSRYRKGDITIVGAKA